MKELKFVQVTKGNTCQHQLLLSLMIPYNKELDSHQNRETPLDFIQKVTQGMIDMQGPHDRHLELCYESETLIGFFYCKVDHLGHLGFIKPEYGYIMEYYVIHEFRHKGYGKAMFERIESLFRSHGVQRMYLTADPVTGKPFWEALGFQRTGETSPENGLDIYEKDIPKQEKLITIQISKYLTHTLAEKIAAAQWHSCAPEWIDQIRLATYEDSYFYDCFEVVALDQNDAVIGRLHCVQNESNQNLWYYGDLFVIPEYRRMGIATQMIHAAIDHLRNLGAKTLRAYVSPDNLPSITLQKSTCFEEKPYQGFNHLILDGELMFELDLPCPYSVIPAKTDEAVFVTRFYWQNIESLHGKPISLDEWKDILSLNDEDEQNFLVCRGCMPLAWLRINGLLNKDMAWISMLVVSDKHHRQGVGSYAIEFSEKFVKEKGFRKIGVHTTEDNIPAQNLYRKCGYAVTEYSECTTGDGVRRMGYTFVKEM